MTCQAGVLQKLVVNWCHINMLWVFFTVPVAGLLLTHFSITGINKHTHAGSLCKVMVLSAVKFLRGN